MGEVSTHLLLQMVEQNDRKHEAGHRRLRHDLTEGFNDVTNQLEALRTAQAADHDRVVTHEATRERRKELSGYRVVLLAAVIGGGFRLIEVILTTVAALYHGHP